MVFPADNYGVSQEFQDRVIKEYMRHVDGLDLRIGLIGFLGEYGRSSEPQSKIIGNEGLNLLIGSLYMDLIKQKHRLNEDQFFKLWVMQGENNAEKFDFAALEELYNTSSNVVLDSLDKVRVPTIGNSSKDYSATDIDALIKRDDLINLYFRDLDLRLLNFLQERALSITASYSILTKFEETLSKMEELPTLPENLAKYYKNNLNELTKQSNEYRNTLMLHNQALVISVAKRYIGKGLDLGDLIQEGSMGLMIATQKFDYSKGYRFTTYAMWWIRQRISRGLGNNARTIRLPIHLRDRVVRMWKTYSKLQQTYGEDPTPEDLAKEMDTDVSKIEYMLNISQPILSLENTIYRDEESFLGDFIVDEGSISPAENSDQEQLKQELEIVLSTLSPRDAKIIKLRYGLQDGKSYTLKQIGDKHDLTRERIRQIERRALKKMRHPIRSRKLKDFLERS